MRVFVLVVVLCVFWHVCPAWSVESDGQVYKEVLTRLLHVSEGEVSEEQIQRLNDARRAFWQFAEDNPGSIFADDSRFVYSLVEFMGAVMVPPRDIEGADQMIALMDRTVRAYPDGRIEELTYSILRQELGEAAVGGSFYIPYNLIVEYMQALKASQTRDYRNAIAGYSRLKEALAPIDDDALAIEIYVPLYIAYTRSGKKVNAQTLLDELKRAYPGLQLEAVLEKQGDAAK